MKLFQNQGKSQGAGQNKGQDKGFSTIASICAFLAICLGFIAPSVYAQDNYPTKPLKLIIPYAPGGATDTLGRVLALALGEKLGQSVVVENKPGAGTALGAGILASATPDGYTLMLGANSTLTINPVVRKSLPYDPIKSFTPIGMVADMSLILVAANNTPVETLKNVVDQVKASPDKFSYGSFGAGTTSHFGAELLNYATGIKMLHIPYNGSSASLTALMGGQVPLAVDSVVATMPQIKANKIKPIAVLSSKRLATFPQVPTVAESGYPGFEMGSWFAVLAPNGLPVAVHRKLETTLANIVNTEEMKKKLTDIGLVPIYGNSKQTTSRIEAELPKMRAAAVRANISPD